MTFVERAACWLKCKSGLGDSSAVIVAIRPYFDRLLNVIRRRRGLERSMAGQEPIRIRPVSRYYRDDFEAGLFRFIGKVIQPGDVVLEIGANIGIFTALLGRWVGPHGHVYAFEPAPETRSRLLDHMTLNHVEDRVTVIAEAVSDVSGRAPFQVIGTSGQNALAPRRNGAGAAQTVEVSVTTIDAFCAQRGVVPAIIKIDIEGYEIHALRGARHVLATYSPIVIVELHVGNWRHVGVCSQDLDDLLLELRATYRTECLEETADSMSPYGHLVLLPRAGVEARAAAESPPAGVKAPATA